MERSVSWKVSTRQLSDNLEEVKTLSSDQQRQTELSKHFPGASLDLQYYAGSRSDLVNAGW